MKYGTLLFVLLFILNTCYGQFNDSVFHQLVYASTGVINKTNEGSSYVLNNILKYNIRKKIISLNFSGSWIYGEQQSRVTNKDYTTTLDVSIFKTTRRFYYWGLGNFEKSYSLKINSRLQLGLGAAYNLVNEKSAWVNLSDGLLYETSDLYQDPLKRDIYQTIRNSFLLRFRWVLKEIIVLDGTNYIQHSLSNKEDYIIRLNNSLSFKLRKWLSLSTAVGFNKSNRTRRENLLITYGLNLEKYF
ncbi:MAG: DUF481 domain-containing protein [Chitinophagaceae bacterium]